MTYTTDVCVCVCNVVVPDWTCGLARSARSQCKYCIMTIDLPAMEWESFVWAGTQHSLYQWWPDCFSLAYSVQPQYLQCSPFHAARHANKETLGRVGDRFSSHSVHKGKQQQTRTGLYTNCSSLRCNTGIETLDIIGDLSTACECH